MPRKTKKDGTGITIGAVFLFALLGFEANVAKAVGGQVVIVGDDGYLKGVGSDVEYLCGKQLS